MKNRILLVTGVALLQSAGIGTAIAGGVENLHNFSAEYIRTLNRNAATDSADAVVYNPAGTATMEDGTYINGSIQNLTKDYSNIVSGTNNGQDDTYSQDEPSLIPSFFGLYKKGDLSYYGAMTAVSGGGEVDYKSGNATIQIANLLLRPGFLLATGNAVDTAIIPVTSARVQAESKGAGITIGAAYHVNDTVSVSLGLRQLTSKKSSQIGFVAGGGFAPAATVAVDYEAEASGVATILGVNFQPNESLNLALRYEGSTKLDYKYSINSGTNTTGNGLLLAQGITDGMKKRTDLPGILALGASYKFSPELKVDVNITQYMQKDANWAGAEDDVDNGQDTGIAFEYSFSDKLRGSFGYMKTETGQDPEDTIAESPKLDATSMALGMVYGINDNMELNVGYAVSNYDDDSYIDSTTGLTIGYEKAVTQLAVGLQYRF